jgi:hypothetical protein
LIIQNPLLNGTGTVNPSMILDPQMLQSTCQMENQHAPNFTMPTEEGGLIGQVDQAAAIGTVGRIQDIH